MWILGLKGLKTPLLKLPDFLQGLQMKALMKIRFTA